MASFTRFGNDLYTGARSFDFIGRRRLWYLIAAVAIVLSIVLPFVRGGTARLTAAYDEFRASMLPAGTGVANSMADVSYGARPLHMRAARWWIIAVSRMRYLRGKWWFWVLFGFCFMPYALMAFFLFIQGLETLKLRMQCHSENALAAAKFLDMLGTSSGEDLSPWLIAGIKVPIQMFACHLLNESLVHGFDIARAERITWPIDPSHAGVVLMGFIFPVVAKLDPRAMVDQEKAAGVRACYDIRVRRAGRVFLIFDDGSVSVEPPSSRPVDCHMSADATALLLVMWARKSQWPAVLTAQITTWGRKPWLGAKLRTMIRNP